jgi:hypothetical protein
MLKEQLLLERIECNAGLPMRLQDLDFGGIE